VTSTKLRDGIAGAVAAGLALGVSEFVAGLVASLPSLIESLGNWVIDIVPLPVKDFAIETFGTNDKLALLIGITVVTLLLGIVVGIVSRKHFWIAMGVFGAFAVLASLAGARNPAVSIGVAIIPAGLAALTGLGALQWLYTLGETGDVSEEDSSSRRAFIIATGAVVGAAALSAGFGRMLLERGRIIAAGRAEVVLPTPVEAAPPVPSGAEFGIDGLAPAIVPNEDFYRIDTAFDVPRVNLPEWRLKLTGRVERPYEITYADLLDMPMVERTITLSCVSNEVGGNLVGNAKWLGVPLVDILTRARPAADAEQLVGRDVDGFTVGFPLEAAFDGRDALVAVGMNDEPLPFEHGFPARLVVAGLYGYVSATKWLSEIELTGWDEFDAYWVPRGWAKEAPIKTQSRIDTPMNRSTIEAQPRTVAGVAWAPTRGISKVEVQLGEDADWVEAELSIPLSDDAWVQWKAEWADPAPGRHRLRVRATDGEGNTQTEEIRPPAPDGATGYHSVLITVS
jgi:DMSO/TMAO reductase YedYZ molybdopterin-dependent catalytic subunit